MTVPVLSESGEGLESGEKTRKKPCPCHMGMAFLYFYDDRHRLSGGAHPGSPDKGGRFFHVSDHYGRRYGRTGPDHLSFPGAPALRHYRFPVPLPGRYLPGQTHHRPSRGNCADHGRAGLYQWITAEGKAQF